MFDMLSGGVLAPDNGCSPGPGVEESPVQAPRPHVQGSSSSKSLLYVTFRYKWS